MGQTKRRKHSGFWQGITLAVAAGLILFAGWGFSQETKATRAYTPNNLMRRSQEAVPAEKLDTMSQGDVVRLHVKGNSNEQADQDVKVLVKDAIMDNFGETLLNAGDASEAERILSKALPQIEDVAAKCLRQNGFSYGAEAAVKVTYFPDKYYETAGGGLVYLPAGEYKALVVNLGTGAGDNWWCVMYPPLCYLDLVQRVLLKQGSQGDSITPKQAAVIVDELSTKNVPVEVRSLLLDSIRAGLARISDLLARIRTMPASASNMP